MLRFSIGNKRENYEICYLKSEGLYRIMIQGHAPMEILTKTAKVPKIRPYHSWIGIDPQQRALNRLHVWGDRQIKKLRRASK